MLFFVQFFDYCVGNFSTCDVYIFHVILNIVKYTTFLHPAMAGRHVFVKIHIDMRKIVLCMLFYRDRLG